jgi:flagellar hook-associated protein 2
MPSVDGIVSGLDTTGLINAIVTARRVSLDTLSAQKGAFEKQREAVAGMKNRLTAISDAFAKMDEASKFRSYSATTASTAFKLTTTDAAVPGDYAIRVEQLAAAQTSSSQGYAARDVSYFSAGTFQVTVGGTTTDVDLTDTTLDGLATALNQVAGLDAYVIDTGAPTDRYRLMIQGTSTGAAGAFSADFSAIGGGPTLTEQTTAVDARIVIGGVTIHSASNTLNGAIPGVRIDLLAENTAPELGTVALDAEATQAKVQAVLDAYNEVVNYYDVQTAFDTDKDIRGPLVGEATSRRAVEDIGRMISSPYTVSGTTLRGLSELGVSTQRDGKLELDADLFAEKLAADPEAVEAFLTSADGPFAKLRARIDDTMVDPDAGSLVSRGKSLDSTIEDLEERIAIGEDRISAEATRLRAQFTAMESILGQLQSTSSSIAAMFSAATSAG